MSAGDTKPIGPLPARPLPEPLRLHLSFVLEPVGDVEVALAPYLAAGFRILIKPDDETVLLAAPGSPHADLMLEESAFEDRGGPGPVFRVASVDRYYGEHGGAVWVCPPTAVPAGRYATFQVGSRWLRLFDISAGVAWSTVFR